MSERTRMYVNVHTNNPDMVVLRRPSDPGNEQDVILLLGGADPFGPQVWMTWEVLERLYDQARVLLAGRQAAKQEGEAD